MARQPLHTWSPKGIGHRGPGRSYATLRETMRKVGVVDKPDIYFLNG